MLLFIMKHILSRRLYSLISVWVSLVLLSLLLFFICSPKNIHTMNIKRRFCVMINFHVIKLAKGPAAKNICELMCIIIHWTCAPPFSVSFCFCFLRRFSFHTHLAIVCFNSTSLLVIWLVGFDQSQCQPALHVCVCSFY